MASITQTLAHLGDTSRQLQRKELRQLNDIGAEGQREFWTAWQRIEASRRREIAVALAELAEDNPEFDFRDVFKMILSDAEPDVRVAAVDGLWEDERLSTMRDLIPILNDDDSTEVRAATALALGRFAYRASCDELPQRAAVDLRAVLVAVAANLDLPDELRRRVVESAGYFEGDDVTGIIAQAYASGRRPLKESALVAMGHSLDARWLPVFEAELQSNEAPLRYEAARAGGELGPAATSLLPRLLPLVDDNDLEVAQAAIWALGQIGGEAAQRTLKRLASSRNAVLKQAAEDALSESQLDFDSLEML